MEVRRLEKKKFWFSPHKGQFACLKVATMLACNVILPFTLQEVHCNSLSVNLGWPPRLPFNQKFVDVMRGFQGLVRGRQTSQNKVQLPWYVGVGTV